VSAFDFTVTVEAHTDVPAPPSAVTNADTTGVGPPDVLVRTLAGKADEYGYVDGIATQARFMPLPAIAVDASGAAYVADPQNFALRRIAPDGRVGTLHQGGSMSRVAVSPDGKTVYSADAGFNSIQRLTLTGPDPMESASWTSAVIAGGSVSGHPDGLGPSAGFVGISGMALDPTGNNLYVTEGNRVRRIYRVGPDPDNANHWKVTTVAGDTSGTSGAAGTQDGPGTAARFNTPSGIAIDGSGNLYVAEFNNHRIRKIVSPSGSAVAQVSTVAGGVSGDVPLADYTDGPGATARFNSPWGIAADSAGYLYVADRGSARIRRVSPNGVVTTVVGNGSHVAVDGPGDVASLGDPAGIAVDASGNLYVAESNTTVVRLIQRLLK
jgi:sugar lactone lactonase YvrE